MSGLKQGRAKVHKQETVMFPRKISFTVSLKDLF